METGPAKLYYFKAAEFENDIDIETKYQNNFQFRALIPKCFGKQIPSSY
jgi:hypothetical protein